MYLLCTRSVFCVDPESSEKSTSTQVMIYLFSPKHRACKVHIGALTYKEIQIESRVHNCIWRRNLSTFCFLRGLYRSTTSDQDMVAFPTVKKNFIFKKSRSSAHSPRPLPITSHHQFPSYSAPKCQETLYLHKMNTRLPRMLCPHFRTTYDTNVHLLWLDNSQILPPR